MSENIHEQLLQLITVTCWKHVFTSV